MKPNKVYDIYIVQRSARRMTRQERRMRRIENAVNVAIVLCSIASMIYCGYVLRGWVG